VSPKEYFDKLGTAFTLSIFRRGAAPHYYITIGPGTGKNLVIEGVKASDEGYVKHLLKENQLYSYPEVDVTFDPSTSKITVKGPVKLVNVLEGTLPLSYIVVGRKVLTIKKAKASDEQYVKYLVRKNSLPSDPQPLYNFDSEKKELAVTGSAELVAALEAMKLLTEEGALKETTDSGPTAASISTWDIELKYAQAKTLQIVQKEGGSNIVIPGVVELVTHSIGHGVNKDGQILPGIPNVRAHPRKNSILITDFTSYEHYYRNLVASLDQPRDMVEISIGVVDVNTSNDLSWAAELLVGSNGSDGEYRSDARIGSFAGAGDLNPAIDAINDGTGILNPTHFRSDLVEGEPFTATGLVVNSTTRLLARISTLEKSGDAQLLSRPSLVTLSGLEANFADSARVFVNVSGIDQANTFEIPVTTQIRVVPRVAETRDGVRSVQMAVILSDSSVVESKEFLPGTPTPVVASSNLYTQAEILDGGSLIVGGRYINAQGYLDRQVPILGRIPILGLPFKQKLVNNQRLQRFYIISPRLIRAGSNPSDHKLDVWAAGEKLPQEQWKVKGIPLDEAFYLEEEGQKKQVAAQARAATPKKSSPPRRGIGNRP
jgi:type II secretory pathway component GspD/PulD (secretin)